MIEPRIKKYPGLLKAALEIAYDNGMINRTCPEENFLSNTDEVLASLDEADIVKFNDWLLTLSDSDLVVLCTGSVVAMDEVARSAPVGGPESKRLTVILDDIFDNC